jgi:deoxyribodipyrimidine photo-lyase
MGVSSAGMIGFYLTPMEKTYPSGLMWFRRDLRASDNAALFHALKSCEHVHCVFVFDTAILDPLPLRDRRIEFIRDSLVQLDAQLRVLAGSDGAGLVTRHGVALQEIGQLARELHVQSVFANHDDEPQAVARDAAVRGALAEAGIGFHTFKDQAIFERSELLTQSGKPYAVFTPYKNAWLAKAEAFYFKAYPVETYAGALVERPAAMRLPVPSLEALGFAPTNLHDLKLPTGADGARALLSEFLARLPGGEGPELPGRPPALRHRLDPRTRGHGMAAGAGRQCGRRGLAGRTGLA